MRLRNIYERHFGLSVVPQTNTGMDKMAGHANAGLMRGWAVWVGLGLALAVGGWRLVVGAIVVTVGVVAVAVYPIVAPRLPPRRPRNFGFLSRGWQCDSARGEGGADAGATAVSDSFLVNEAVNAFIKLVLASFVDGWFGSISQDRGLLQMRVHAELVLVLLELKQRVARVDLASMLVSRVLPTIHDHYVSYCKAEEVVRHKEAATLAHDIAVAQHYKRGHLHPAVAPAARGQCGPAAKAWLRERVGAVVPLLLSEGERQSRPVVLLVREMLSCTVLANVLLMVSEADFYNLLVVKMIGNHLKHRTQVKRLREALAEHTGERDETIRGIEAAPLMAAFRSFLELTGYKAFKELYDQIDHIGYVQQSRQLETLLAGRLGSGRSSKYDKRLRLLVERLHRRTVELANRVRSSHDVDLPAILGTAAGAAKFAEYLQRRDRLPLLDFYRAVEQIKVPLEEAAALDDEDLVADMALSVSADAQEDIVRIYKSFCFVPAIDMDRESIEVIEDYVTAATIDTAARRRLYVLARRELLKMQNKVYDRLVEELPGFQRSSLFVSLVESDVFPEKPDEPVPSVSEPAAEPHDDTLRGGISGAVVSAVEDAFSEIMRASTSPPTEVYQAVHGSSTSLETDLKRDLFGEPDAGSSLFGDTEGSHSLFDGDEESDAMATTELDSDMTSLQELFLAAPGNLRLTEEIAKLELEIQRLSQQLQVLTPLLNKAELTNNLGEIKILMRSKASLEKEISYKELQKQQYMVQENDNSLYGRSRAAIQSYIIGNEGNKEFVLYIVEVQRLSSESPDTVTAGWIVARRYSQFLKLHEYLKQKYPRVGQAKFPKRAVLVLKFQQRQVAEMRKVALSEYLGELLSVPEVCCDRAFRAFLSSENLSVRKSQVFEERPSARSNIERMANTLYGPSQMNPQMIANLSEMQDELRKYEEVGERDLFVKPICDALILLFELNTTKTWLRGRALVVILQQVFGTTIERKVYEFVELQSDEENVLDCLAALEQQLFPGGRFRNPPAARSVYEQSATKQEARVLFDVFFHETCARLFGLANTMRAASGLFSMMQNEVLNQHLLFELLDVVLTEVFPEV